MDQQKRQNLIVLESKIRKNEVEYMSHIEFFSSFGFDIHIKQILDQLEIVTVLVFWNRKAELRDVVTVPWTRLKSGRARMISEPLSTGKISHVRDYTQNAIWGMG